MDNYIQINGRNYALDLEKAMKFIANDGAAMTTIGQTYGSTDEGDGLTLQNKEVTETKETVSETLSEYRYNLITNLINLLITPIADGEGTLMPGEDMVNMLFGQKLAFNTLLDMEIIYEIDD